MSRSQHARGAITSGSGTEQPPASTIFHRALLYLIAAGGSLGAGYQSGQWTLALLIAAPLLVAGGVCLRRGCVRLGEER